MTNVFRTGVLCSLIWGLFGFLPAFAFNYDEIVTIVQAEEKVFGQADYNKTLDQRLASLEEKVLGGTQKGSESLRLRRLCRTLGMEKKEGSVIAEPYSVSIAAGGESPAPRSEALSPAVAGSTTTQQAASVSKKPAGSRKHGAQRKVSVAAEPNRMPVTSAPVSIAVPEAMTGDQVEKTTAQASNSKDIVPAAVPQPANSSPENNRILALVFGGAFVVITGACIGIVVCLQQARTESLSSFRRRNDDEFDEFEDEYIVEAEEAIPLAAITVREENGATAVLQSQSESSILKPNPADVSDTNIEQTNLLPIPGDLLAPCDTAVDFSVHTSSINLQESLLDSLSPDFTAEDLQSEAAADSQAQSADDLQKEATDVWQAQVTDDLQTESADDSQAQVTDGLQIEVADNSQVGIADNLQAEVTDDSQAVTLDRSVFSAELASDLDASMFEMPSGLPSIPAPDFKNKQADDLFEVSEAPVEIKSSDAADEQIDHAFAIRSVSLLEEEMFDEFYSGSTDTEETRHVADFSLDWQSILINSRTSDAHDIDTDNPVGNFVEMHEVCADDIETASMPSERNYARVGVIDQEFSFKAGSLSSNNIVDYLVDEKAASLNEENNKPALLSFSLNVSELLSDEEIGPDFESECEASSEDYVIGSWPEFEPEVSPMISSIGSWTSRHSASCDQNLRQADQLSFSPPAKALEVEGYHALAQLLIEAAQAA